MWNTNTIPAPVARSAKPASAGPHVLTAAALITGLTATLPAGILPAMSADLGVNGSATGQTLTAYAIGTALTAIPLTPMAARWRRRPSLLTAMAAFAVACLVTAFSVSYPLTLGARVLAGAAAGVVWAAVAGGTRGRTPSRAMVAIPVGLALGLPAGTVLGELLGGRFALASMAAFGALTAAWIALSVPDSAARPATTRDPALPAVRVAGTAAVLLTALVLAGAHMVRSEIGVAIGVVVLIAARAAGVWIGRRLPPLPVPALLTIAGVAAIAAWFTGHPAPIYLAVVLFGLAWGGAPVLDEASTGSLAALWNTAMAVGGVVGGVLLGLVDFRPTTWAAMVALIPTLAVALTIAGGRWPSRR